MEALGVAASVAGLISLALEVPKLIDALVRIRAAPEEARQMSRTAGALVLTLQKLEAFLKTEDAREMKIADDSALTVSLSVCQSKILDLSRKLRSQSGTHSNPSGNAVSNALKAAAIKVRWPLDRKECLEIISEMHAMECTFQFCLVIHNCQQMSRSHKEVVSYLKTQSDTLSQMAASFPEQAASATTMVEKLNNIAICVSKASKMIDHVQIRLQELEEMKSDLAELYTDKLHGQVLEWLSPLDPSARHEELRCARVDGTCEWIHTDDDFQRWVLNPPSGHLADVACWVGDPGQGKTFTMSRVIDFLEEHRRSKSDMYVTYLYCDYQSTSNYSVTALLGALIRQLLCGFGKIPDQISDLVRQAHIKQRRSSCRVEEMKEVMMFLKPHIKRLFLCIDALDEYNDAVDLVSACRELPFPTSLFFIGRRSITQPVKHSFPGTVERVLQYQTADINTVVSALVEKEKNYRPELMPTSLYDEILAEVEGLANGMFLLASLHTNLVLSHTTVFRRREALQNLPKTLDSAFTRTFARIREQVQASQALIILAWIQYVGPMSLDELRHALAIEPHHTQFHGDNLPDIKNMLHCCLGLVRLDTSQRVSLNTEINLVHSTLSCFLNSSPTILQEGLTMVADTCLTYLLFDEDQRVGAIDRLINKVWLRLLKEENTIRTTQIEDKVWAYIKLTNERMGNQRSLLNIHWLSSHARGLVWKKSAIFSSDKPCGVQTLLHTVCMLGLDIFDSILDRVAEDTAGREAGSISNTDMFGVSALGWIFFAQENDGGGEFEELPLWKEPCESNIHRAGRIIQKFCDLDLNQPLWDVSAAEAIRTLRKDQNESNQIEYFARLPLLFFLSNYRYFPESIGRCLSLIENRSKSALWSALLQSTTSTPTSKGIDVSAADALEEQQDPKWILAVLYNEAAYKPVRFQIIDESSVTLEDMPPARKRVRSRHSPSSGGSWTGSPLEGVESDEMQPGTTESYSSALIRPETIALFKLGSTTPTIVAASHWKHIPVSTYCAARADVSETLSRPLPGTLCRIITLPHQALLHLGAAADNACIINFALTDFRVDPNMPDHSGKTALQLALDLGCRSAAQVLIKCDGIDLMSSDDLGQSPLHLCLKSQYWRQLDMKTIVLSILSRCHSVLNAQDKSGKTALHYAVETGNRSMTSLLLRCEGVDVNIQDTFGQTPLHIAIVRRDMVICEIILERTPGLAISSENLRVAWTLIMSAGASFIIPLLRFVQRLIDNQVMPDNQHLILSPLTAYGRGLLQLVDEASESPDFTGKDLDFMLALEMSTAHSPETARNRGIIALGVGGASIDPDDAAKTIRAAIFKGAGSVAAYLMGIYAVDLDHFGEDGESAIHLAVVYNASQAVQFLTNRSEIDVNKPDPEGYTALQLAVIHKRLVILQMLLGSPRVQAGQVHGSSDETALILAVKHRFAESFPILLAAHERLSVNHLDRSGSSALHYAVMQNDAATVRLLLGCPGLVPTLPSRDGRTALAHAAMFATMEMISLLLNTGEFDLGHKDNYGKTAFDWAKTNPCAEVIEALRIGN